LRTASGRVILRELRTPLATHHAREPVGLWGKPMSTIPDARSGRVDRRLYAWAAAVTVLIAFGGFARTYYLKLAFGTPPLPAILHVHGLLMTL
jgi:hypothetical protein